MSDQEASSSSNTVDDTTPALQTLVEAILAELGNPDGMREELRQITVQTDQSDKQKEDSILSVVKSYCKDIAAQRKERDARYRQERDITTQSRGTMTDRWDPMDFTIFKSLATGKRGAMTKEEARRRTQLFRESLRKWVDGWQKSADDEA